MKRIMIITWFYCMAISHAIGQYQGDTWLIGYSWSPHPEYSLIELDFNSGNLEMRKPLNEFFTIGATCSNISDINGRPILSTNGMEIRGPHVAVVEDTISYVPDDWENVKPSFWNWWYDPNRKIPVGFPSPNGAIILPSPAMNDEFYVIYSFFEWDERVSTFTVFKWLHAKVIREDTESYKLVYRDSLIGAENMEFQLPIKAVRHANGRDWWLYSFIRNTRNFQLILLDDTGLHFQGLFDSGIDIPDGVGLATISPKGNYLALGCDVTGNYDQHTFLFDIDRCSGKLFFKDSFSLETQYGPGFGFSPSEKYLYTCSKSIYLWQFDMEAENIGDSKVLVGEWDGFIHGSVFATTFGPIMQTPDGRLYVVPTSGSNEYLHVIDRPDEPGTDCKLLQHSVFLTVPQGRSAPNIPNYRLGPIDGSLCDTLGIDNKATSRWRWEVDDPSDPLTIRFTDLAFYEPETWAWTFDDGNTSDIPSPIHTFPDYGLYHVCQTVENEYQRDSTCKWIELMPTVSTDDPTYSRFSVQPNPFDDELQIRYNGSGYTSGSMIITDLHGRVVMHTGEVPVPITLQMPDLPSGMYICTIQDEAGRMTTMKVVRR